jgi:8-oxo-dGTP pyrophosphatase MutT (NUDIX family)
MKKAIEVLARGVCMRQGRVLLCRTRGANVTYQDAEAVRHPETARQALEREIREELGLRGRAGRYLGCIEHAFRQRGRWHAEINLVFELRLAGVSAARAPTAREAWLEFEWRTPRELRAAAFEPAALAALLPRWWRAPGGFASGGVWRQP